MLNNGKTVSMQKLLFLSLLLISQTVFAQFHFGVFLGGSNYIGELNDKLFKKTKPTIGLSLNYEVSERVMLRTGLTFGKIEGADKFSGTQFLKQNRNLHFKSPITEFNLLGELTAFNLYNIRWSPYGFAGIAVFHFNPYTTDSSNQKIYLQPLSTEGQGLPTYPDRKPYALTGWSIPFGGGIKFNVNENVRLGVELGLRKLFTDYLDDVSTTYADENLLLDAKGAKAVQLAYRGDEVPGEDTIYPDNGYPAKDAQRGNPKTKDWYYFTGLHLTFRLGGGYGKTFASGHKKGYGCPVNPL